MTPRQIARLAAGDFDCHDYVEINIGGEGPNQADFMTLDTPHVVIRELAQSLNAVRAALEWYADGKHFFLNAYHEPRITDIGEHAKAALATPPRRIEPEIACDKDYARRSLIVQMLCQTLEAAKGEFIRLGWNASAGGIIDRINTALAETTPAPPRARGGEVMTPDRMARAAELAQKHLVALKDKDSPCECDECEIARALLAAMWPHGSTEQLVAEINKLRKALEFYADLKIHRERPADGTMLVFDDGGRIAREALKAVQTKPVVPPKTLLTEADFTPLPTVPITHNDALNRAHQKIALLEGRIGEYVRLRSEHSASARVGYGAQNFTSDPSTCEHERTTCHTCGVTFEKGKDQAR